MSECCIKFPEPVSRGTISRLVIEYLKYILYYRGQFPLPLDQLKQSIENNVISKDPAEIDKHPIYYDHTSKQSISKPSFTKDRTKQLFEDTIQTFDTFFNQLSSILEEKTVLEVVMNLGPNMMSPKEFHRITLPSHCSHSECLQNSNTASFHRSRLQFFRTIMHDNLLAELNSDCILPISILLLLQQGAPISEHMEQKRFYNPPKRCKQVSVKFDNVCDHTVTVEESEESSAFWVKLKQDLRGFKAHKSFSSSAL